MPAPRWPGQGGRVGPDRHARTTGTAGPERPLALTTGSVDPGLAPLAATYVLLMAILGPVAARVVEPVYGAVTRRLRPSPS